MLKYNETSIEQSGIIYIGGEIEDNMTNYVCRELLKLNVHNKHNLIQIFINSPGGDVACAFAIVELMKISLMPIHTIGIGEVSSSALLIFMAGDERFISSNAEILSHQYSTSSEGNHSDLDADRRRLELIYKKMLKHYIKYTKLKTKKKIEDTLLKPTDTYLTSVEAIKYGLADKIIK